MSTTKIATEAHPLKRARLDTDETGLNHCTHHPTFFLPDGNVVLVCEAILFRTYKGLLSRHSEIFWDMFSLSSHQPADAEVYDGCPVVRLQDTAQDFTYLMSAMLDTQYACFCFCDNGPLITILVSYSPGNKSCSISWPQFCDFLPSTTRLGYAVWLFHASRKYILRRWPKTSLSLIQVIKTPVL